VSQSITFSTHLQFFCAEHWILCSEFFPNEFLDRNLSPVGLAKQLDCFLLGMVGELVAFCRYVHCPDILIKYANFLVDMISPKKIYFLHLLQSYDLPDEIIEELPEMEKPLTELIREDLQEKIEKEFKSVDGLIVSVHVEEGVKSDTLLQFTRDKKINVISFGKKVGYIGAGSLPRRVMPLTPSSVLLVNTSSALKLDKFLVRVDFSKMSEIAMKTATMLANQTDAKVSSFHACKIPISHFPQYSPEDEKRGKRK
jgi:nucleotide-binding universal stress UspA family protein